MKHLFLSLMLICAIHILAQDPEKHRENKFTSTTKWKEEGIKAKEQDGKLSVSASDGLHITTKITAFKMSNSVTDDVKYGNAIIKFDFNFVKAADGAMFGLNYTVFNRDDENASQVNDKFMLNAKGDLLVETGQKSNTYHSSTIKTSQNNSFLLFKKGGVWICVLNGDTICKHETFDDEILMEGSPEAFVFNGKQSIEFSNLSQQYFMDKRLSAKELKFRGFEGIFFLKSSGCKNTLKDFTLTVKPGSFYTAVDNKKHVQRFLQFLELGEDSVGETGIMVEVIESSADTAFIAPLSLRGNKSAKDVYGIPFYKGGSKLYLHDVKLHDDGILEFTVYNYNEGRYWTAPDGSHPYIYKTMECTFKGRR